IAFNIASAAAGTYQLTVADQQFGDINQDPVSPSGTVNGSMEVLGPDADFTPNGGLFSIGPVQSGVGPDPSANIVVDNVGGTGTTLNWQCLESGDASNAFSYSGGTTGVLPENAGTQQFSVICDS